MAAKLTTTPKDSKARAAKRAFFVSLFDLSWKMANAMLLPIFLGLYIDSRRGHGQTFALIGFAVGMVCGVLVIRGVVKRLSKEVQE